MLRNDQLTYYVIMPLTYPRFSSWCGETRVTLTTNNDNNRLTSKPRGHEGKHFDVMASGNESSPRKSDSPFHREDDAVNESPRLGTDINKAIKPHVRDPVGSIDYSLSTKFIVKIDRQTIVSQLRDHHSLDQDKRHIATLIADLGSPLEPVHFTKLKPPVQRRYNIITTYTPKWIHRNVYTEMDTPTWIKEKRVRRTGNEKMNN